MKHSHRVTIIFTLILLSACQPKSPEEMPQETTRPVEKSEAHHSTFEDFISSIATLDELNDELQLTVDMLPSKMSFRSDAWMKIMELSQKYETLEASQDAIEQELAHTGELVLEPGQSYSLKLESFCIEPGVSPPRSGDGLNISPNENPHKDWILELLKKLGTLNLSQDSVQTLIWDLLYDITFEELNEKSQSILLSIYPDARIRFAHRKDENDKIAQEDEQDEQSKNFILNSNNDIWKHIKSRKKELLKHQNDYHYLARILAPKSARKNASMWDGLK